MSETLRRESILEAAVREFIATGEPVSSSRLFSQYNFGIRPAMIRLELIALTEEGFLEQPHPSAGRIPSDRGYEFFAKRALKETAPEQITDQGLVHSLMSQAWDQAAECLAKDLGLLGAISAYEDSVMHKEGLENLIDKLNWARREEIKTVIHDFEELDRRVEEFRNLNSDFGSPDVFIGKKSPITKSNDLSVMVGKYDSDSGNFFLFAIGPKRMNYQKAARTFKGLQNVNKRHGRTTKTK